MRNHSNWKILLILSIIFILSIVIVTFLTGYWVFLALGAGFLFGFTLQKGDLCGASAMSEVILLKDSRKLFGLWIAILSGMIGFTILSNIGIIELAPKKFIWLSAITGGFIFGIGTVLAGGCVSGCMYKGASGNINSIVALLTIPIGISFVEYGPLKDFSKYLLTYVINDAEGKAITLHSLIGIPHWVITLILLVITILLVIKNKSKNKKDNLFDNTISKTKKIFTKSWKPWQAGIAIGIIGCIAWLISLPTGRNYPLGVTHGVNYAYQSVIEGNVKYIYEKPKAVVTNIAIADTLQKTNNIIMKKNSSQSISAKTEPRKLNLWLILLSIVILIGSHISARMSGQAKLLPKEPSQTLIAAIGGLLNGIGAAVATGCIVGNIISAWAMLSVGMFIFGIATLSGNWITTYFYLIGGKLFNK